MKNKAINIIAILILTSLFVSGVYSEWSWFDLNNNIEESNKEATEREEQGKEYNKRIKQIYDLSNSNLDSSFDLIDQTREKFPDRIKDLDYVEVRILLNNNQIDKAENLLKNLSQNSNRETPRFSELYAYLQIERGNFEIAERHLLNAAKTNSDYRYQLANLYEVKSEHYKALKLYSEIINEGSINKNSAIRRMDIMNDQNRDELKNIELKDDSKRIHFSIGKLNF